MISLRSLTKSYEVKEKDAGSLQSQIFDPLQNENDNNSTKKLNLIVKNYRLHGIIITLKRTCEMLYI